MSLNSWPIPVTWGDEQPDESSRIHLEDAYFDEALNLWVLSHYDDVVAAFRSPFLLSVGPRGTAKVENSNDAARLKMRAETSEALSPACLGKWRSEMSHLAGTVLDNLPIDKPVNLTDEYARPLCLAIARTVTGPSKTAAERLTQLAEQVSAAAAEPFDPALSLRAKAADTELGKYFHAGPIPLRESGFVALSQTLPCLLTRCWFALLRRPDLWSHLRREPALIGRVVEELLRYAGLGRILFRMAASDMNINGIHIRKGQRIMLRLIAANRDPKRFQNADSVDLTARRKAHVTLGLGGHSCVGAPLIRMAVSAATGRLVERYARATLTQEVEWSGGSGFRFPSSLYVLFRI